MEVWKQIALTMKERGCTNKSIINTLKDIGAPINKRTIYRTLSGIEGSDTINRTLTDRQLGRLLASSFNFKRIIRGLSGYTHGLAIIVDELYDEMERKDGAEAVWDMSGSIRKQREGRYENEGDALPEEQFSMVYYPQQGRPDGLKVYLKRQNDLNRMEQKMDEDFKMEKCILCGVTSSEEFITNGVCEDCIEEFDNGIPETPKRKSTREED